jgi:hypothetical protein
MKNCPIQHASETRCGDSCVGVMWLPDLDNRTTNYSTEPTCLGSFGRG